MESIAGLWLRHHLPCDSLGTLLIMPPEGFCAAGIHNKSAKIDHLFDSLLHFCQEACLFAGAHDRTGVALSATWTRLRFAFAGCLQSALTHQGSDSLDQEDPNSPHQSTQAELGSALPMDPRAVLILELLLAGLTGPAPTLTHLLMGFDVTQGPEGTLA